MDVSLFDFELPEDRVALRPASPRDSARMMVVRAGSGISHHRVRDLPMYLDPGDIVVVNDTRVMWSRLRGMRLRGGGRAKIEVLLHRRLGPSSFAALAKPWRKLAVGDRLEFYGLGAEVTARGAGGQVELAFALADSALDAALAAHGEVPLPPYIAGKRKADLRDREDYQTIFACQSGSAAAPTAGLHFTPELLSSFRERGVCLESITLEVGLGTFLPVTVQDTSHHRMHAERAILTRVTAANLNRARQAGRRIAAVGTTSLRTLESAASPDGVIHPFDGDTDIFIVPGYDFRSAEILLTNFHLPRSTLFMLVCAFMGLDVMKAAYAEAVSLGYRFYSYGDACLLIRKA